MNWVAVKAGDGTEGDGPDFPKPVVKPLPAFGNVIYVGAFLEEGPKHALLHWWQEMIKVPLLPVVKAEHITLKFRPTPEEVNSFPINEMGKTVMLRVIGWAANDDIQAVAVEGDFLNELPFAPPAIPHITISHRPGVAPKESAGLLMAGDTPVEGPTLTAKIGFFTGGPTVLGIPRSSSWIRVRADGDKTVIIMRGLPGAGKSTKARSYGGTIVSADDFFVQEGQYKFDKAGLGRAHEQCRNKFVEALDRGDSPVVVDNTNTTLWEMEFYKKAAKDRGYQVVIDHVDPGLPIEELTKRNIHGVPQEAVERMKRRWEEDK